MPRRARRFSPRHGIAILLAGIVASACHGEVRRGDADLQIRLIVHPAPAVPGPVDLRVEVYDVDWSPKDGARVTLTASLAGAPQTRAEARGQGAGGYLAEGVRMEAAGDWLVTTRVETLDGRWAEVDYRVPVETPAS